MAAGAPELVGAYIGAIGAAEPNYGRFLRSMDDGHPFYPSMAIGHGCLLLTQAPDSTKAARRATALFERANDMLEVQLQTTESPRDEGPLSALQHTARTLLCRDDPTALTTLRDDLNRRTIDTAAWLLWELDETKAYGDRGDILGSLAQQLAIGAYTRRKGVSALPFMALTHHDQGRSRSQNYDTLVVYHNADWMRPRLTKLQIKAGCLALSPEHKGRELSEHNRDLKLHTAKDIVIVSGCCDLGGTERTARTFTAEDSGEAVGRQLRGLNAVSDHMAHIAKGTDTWDRRGTAERRQVPLTEKYLVMMRGLIQGQVPRSGLATL